MAVFWPFPALKGKLVTANRGDLRICIGSTLLWGDWGGGGRKEKGGKTKMKVWGEKERRYYADEGVTNNHVPLSTACHWEVTVCVAVTNHWEYKIWHDLSLCEPQGNVIVVTFFGMLFTQRQAGAHTRWTHGWHMHAYTHTHTHTHTHVCECKHTISILIIYQSTHTHAHSDTHTPCL